MSKLAIVLGLVWALPITVIGLFYVSVFMLFKWYKPIGIAENALVFSTNPDQMPKWLSKLWGGRMDMWGAAIGNIIILDAANSKNGKLVDLKNMSPKMKQVLIHEGRHVKQCMIMGVFQPITYALNYVMLWSLGGHPYYDNSCEIDARRTAEQLIDVPGRIKELEEKARELRSQMRE